MAHHSHRFGFTLLELVVVLVIISTVLAFAAPNLRGWSQGAKLRDAADDFLAVSQFARMHAAQTSKLVRLNVRLNSEERPSYWLTAHDGPKGELVDDKDFVDLSQNLSRGDLPEGFRIELTVHDQQGREYVEFYPNGRISLATVRIISTTGDVEVLECATPTDGFRVKQEADR